MEEMAKISIRCGGVLPDSEGQLVLVLGADFADMLECCIRRTEAVSDSRAEARQEVGVVSKPEVAGYHGELRLTVCRAVVADSRLPAPTAVRRKGEVGGSAVQQVNM